jgi:hypothetical protein
MIFFLPKGRSLALRTAAEGVVATMFRSLKSLAISLSSLRHRIAARNCLELIFACVICALAFVAAELANAPLGWEDELGFHFGAL